MNDEYSFCSIEEDFNKLDSTNFKRKGKNKSKRESKQIDIMLSDIEVKNEEE